jgi:hypothetical protein
MCRTAVGAIRQIIRAVDDNAKVNTGRIFFLLEIHSRIVPSLYCAATCAGLAIAIAIRNRQRNFMAS